VLFVHRDHQLGGLDLARRTEPKRTEPNNEINACLAASYAAKLDVSKNQSPALHGIASQHGSRWYGADLLLT